MSTLLHAGARVGLATLWLTVAATAALADEELSAGAILDRPQGARLESLRVRFTHYDQTGHGYQSQASALVTGPGSEQLTVEQPQVEAVIRHSEKLTTRLWVPLDVVSAASPDAIDQHRLDVISTASRVTEGGTIEFSTRYAPDRRTAGFVRAGFRLEENFRSYQLGAGIERSFADDNTVVSASLNQVVDWFDAYEIHGERLGHVWRSSTNANLGFTQILSPTTVAAVSYGFTLQDRHLGVTWNSVPLDDGTRGPEQLPDQRYRHAIVGRLAQALPWWGGAVKGSYRFYADSWGVTAHTLDGQLYQRVARWLYLRAGYRFHEQSGVYFFTTLAHAGAPDHRSADSDLAPLLAHMVGGRAVLDLRVQRRWLREAEASIGYEYYWRTNDLRVHIVSCGLSFRF